MPQKANPHFFEGAKNYVDKTHNKRLEQNLLQLTHQTNTDEEAFLSHAVRWVMRETAAQTTPNVSMVQSKESVLQENAK